MLFRKRRTGRSRVGETGFLLGETAGWLILLKCELVGERWREVNRVLFCKIEWKKSWSYDGWLLIDFSKVYLSKSGDYDCNNFFFSHSERWIILRLPSNLMEKMIEREWLYEHEEDQWVIWQELSTLCNWFLIRFHKFSVAIDYKKVNIYRQLKYFTAQFIIHFGVKSDHQNISYKSGSLEILTRVSWYFLPQFFNFINITSVISTTVLNYHKSNPKLSDIFTNNVVHILPRQMHQSLLRFQTKKNEKKKE